MEKVVLKAKIRDTVGKSPCKHIRKEGFVPGVVYKAGKKGVLVQVDRKDLWHALHTEAGDNAIITMKISGSEKEVKKTVIVQEVQTDPLNDKYLHADFHEISLKEKIKVNVPIVLKGEAVGVKDEEGVLSQILWEMEVECLPTDIPEHIDIHVDDLKIGDAIHVSDVKIADNVKILEDEEAMIVSVNPPSQEEIESEEGEEMEGAEGSEEPEVIKKGKKEEEEGDEGEGDEE